MPPRHIALGLLLIAPFAVSAPALASFPVSVWAIPDSVVVEGAETKQPSVTITGFMMAFIDKSSSETPGNYGQYSIPRWGVMHYECPAGMAKTCLMEWDDIAAKIDADDCVGWGSQDVPPGLIQPLYAETWTVDAYPIGSGVVTGYTPCQALDAAYVKKPLPPLPDPGPEVAEDAGPGPDVDAGPMPDIDAGPDSDIGPAPDAAQDVDGGAVDTGPGPDIALDIAIDVDLDLDVLPDGWAFDTTDADTWVDWDGKDADSGPWPDAEWDAADWGVPPDSSADADATGPPADVQVADTVPDTSVPPADALDASVPDGSTPDILMPEAGGWDIAVCDTSGPDDAGPDAITPDASTPDTSTPDTSTPDAPGADTAPGDVPAGGGTPDNGVHGGVGCGGAPDSAPVWPWALALALLVVTRRRYAR